MGEGFSGLKAEAVTFELKLAQSLVGEQGARQILSLFVLDALAAQVQGGQSRIVCNDLGDDLSARATKLKTRHGVLAWRLIVLAAIEEDQHAAVEALALLLLLSLFLGIFHGSLVTSLLLLGSLVALLLTITLFFVVSLFQLNGTYKIEVNI